MSWTASEDRQLRAFYAQYPPTEMIPIAEFAALIGKPANTVRGRAFTLGLTVPNRPRGIVAVISVPTPCPVCGAEFIPASRGHGGYTFTCSQECGIKHRMSLNLPHPRGALGMKHNDEAKAKMGAASRRMWDTMSDEERERRSDISRETMRKRVEKGIDASRTHTRARGGRRPDLNNQYFRSRWEANYARWLNWQIANGDVAAWEFEPKTFTFPVKRGTMSYTPDFLVTYKDGRSEWHEVKGWLTQQGATALKRFAKYYPAEVLVLIDADAYRAIAKFARPIMPEWEGTK